MVAKVFVCAQGAKGTASARYEHQSKGCSQVLASLHRDPEEDPRAEDMYKKTGYVAEYAQVLSQLLTGLFG